MIHSNPKDQIVMILVSPKERKLFTGEIKYYEQLLSAVSKKGGKGYVLPLENDPHLRLGYFWDDTERSWIQKECPRPTIVYNRYPWREKENSSPYKEFIQWLEKENIPYFNKGFFNKYTLTRLLQKNKNLKKIFPFTNRLNSMSQLNERLKKNPIQFLKDVHGAQGKGIWKVTKEGDLYHLHSQKKILNDLSFSQLSFFIYHLLRERIILVQEGVSSKKIDNTIFDFRVLMINEIGNWKLTGIGVRQAQKGNFTTHVTHGGKIISYNDIPYQPTEDVVQNFGQQVGHLLESHYDHVKEFSFDLVIDTDENPWIVDVNSKPMSFDEATIQENRIERLVNVFYTNDTKQQAYT